MKPDRNAALKPKTIVAQQTSFLMSTLAEQREPRQSLKQIADVLPWGTFETAFAEAYSKLGGPAKPIRLIQTTGNPATRPGRQ